MKGLLRNSIFFVLHAEIIGFRLPDRVQDRLHRNNALKGFQAFYETVKSNHANRNFNYIISFHGAVFSFVHFH